MNRKCIGNGTAASFVGLVVFLIVALESDCLAQTNQLPSLSPPAFPHRLDQPPLPGRAIRATNSSRLHLTNRLSPVEMEALAKVNAESERRRAAPASLQPLPPPNSGMQLPPRQINIVTNRGPHTNLFGGATAHYEQVLSDPNLPPNLRKTYESSLNDTRQKAAEFQTNQQLWNNLSEAIESGRATDVAKAKGELANFLAAFSKRAYDKSYPTGTSLEVIIADFEARTAERDRTSTNSVLKSPP